MNKTKLAIRAAFALFAASSLSAELYVPRRFVELGVDATAGISNNYLKLEDVLVENLDINLTDIANNMPDGGFELDLLANAKVFFNLNLGQKFRLGFFAGVDSSGWMNIPNDFFDLLGKGYSAGSSVDFDISAYGDIFVNAGINFHTVLFKKYGITLTPTYYVPLVYIDDAKASVHFSTDKESGEIIANVNAPLDVYSTLDLQKYIDNEYETSDITGDIKDSLSKGGFDLSFEVERPILRSLDVGVFGRIPMVPATLDYKMRANAWATFYQSNLLGILDDTSESEYDHGMDDAEYFSGVNKKVWRPLRIGLEAAWRPFGNWFTFRPMFAVVARNPYDSSARQIYPEYAFAAEAVLLKVLGFNVGTALENHTYVQHLGLMINLRVVEIDAKVLLRGGSFINSFSYTGAGAYVGVRVGF